MLKFQPLISSMLKANLVVLISRIVVHYDQSHQLKTVLIAQM